MGKPICAGSNSCSFPRAGAGLDRAPLFAFRLKIFKGIADDSPNLAEVIVTISKLKPAMRSFFREKTDAMAGNHRSQVITLFGHPLPTFKKQVPFHFSAEITGLMAN
jgi:hypothetical protein